MLSEYERMGRKERQHALELINTLKHNLEDDLNFKAKAMGAYVRSAMEDFHVKHLSDEQMKELNPIIRNAIFTFLTDEKNGNLFGISSVCKCNLASYWEDCKYLKM